MRVVLRVPIIIPVSGAGGGFPLGNCNRGAVGAANWTIGEDGTRFAR